MTLVLLKKLQQSQQVSQITQNVNVTPQAAHSKDHSNLLSQLPTGKSAQPPLPHVPHHSKPPPPALNRLVIVLIFFFFPLIDTYFLSKIHFSLHHQDRMPISLTILQVL